MLEMYCLCVCGGGGGNFPTIHRHNTNSNELIFAQCCVSHVYFYCPYLICKCTFTCRNSSPYFFFTKTASIIIVSLLAWVLLAGTLPKMKILTPHSAGHFYSSPVKIEKLKDLLILASLCV